MKKTEIREKANDVAKLYYKNDTCERLELRDRIMEVVSLTEPKQSEEVDSYLLNSDEDYLITDIKGVGQVEIYTYNQVKRLITPLLTTQRVKQSEEVYNLQADIRNKLSPIDNLLEMLQDVFEITKFNPSEILIQEIAQCKISIEYLSNLTTQRVTEPKQSEEVKYSKEEDDFYIETEEGDYYLEPQQVLDRLNLTTKRVTDEEIEERCELLRFSKVLNGNSAEEIFIMGAKWLRDKQ